MGAVLLCVGCWCCRWWRLRWCARRAQLPHYAAGQSGSARGDWFCPVVSRRSLATSSTSGRRARRGARRSRPRSRRRTRRRGRRWRSAGRRPRRARGAGPGWPCRSRGRAPRPSPRRAAVLDLLAQAGQLVLGDRAALAGLADAGHRLLAGERLGRARALEHGQLHQLDGREPLAAAAGSTGRYAAGGSSRRRRPPASRAPGCRCAGSRGSASGSPLGSGRASRAPCRRCLRQ